VRRLLRGESEQLRIGYVGSAADDYLNPALAKLRQTYPAATEDHSNRPTKE
jgi:DNA-binding transcriptional LysR family regulator